MRGVEPDNTIGDGRRRKARLAGYLSGEGGQSRQSLNQVVVSRPSGVGTFLTKTVQAGIDKPRVESEQIVRTKLQSAHRGRPHIVNEHVRGGREPQQGLAATGLLEIEYD